MQVKSRKKIPIELGIFLIFLVIFMFRFIQVTLEKNVIGNLSYVQLLNKGMPLIEATYYDKDAYVESNVTIKSLALEALNIKSFHPIDIVLNEVPYFDALSKISTVEKPGYINKISDIVSFSLNDQSIDMKEQTQVATTDTSSGVYDSSLKKELDQSVPEVLIYHTHTAEGYSINDTTDENLNVVGVGDTLAKELEENYGISVIHDKTMHSISYNDSYKRSRETVQSYLAKYGNFKLIIDLHRDAVSESSKSAVTTNINGEDLARFMFVVTKNNSNYDASVSLATRLTEKSEELFPGLWRGKLMTYNRGSNYFNQDLSANSLLVEIGANCNTPQESNNTARYLARLIAEELNR